MPNLNRVKNYKGISLEDLWIKDKIIKALIFNRKQHNTPYMSEIVRSVGFTSGLTRVTIYRPALSRKVIKETNSKISQEIISKKFDYPITLWTAGKLRIFF